jgi:hypothetical protein
LLPGIIAAIEMALHMSPPFPNGHNYGLPVRFTGADDSYRQGMVGHRILGCRYDNQPIELVFWFEMSSKWRDP